MGRPKGFNRDDLLEKAIQLFSKKGFADTSLQDLQRATRVNKSGLYTEFKSKEDLFLSSLRHYIERSGAREVLSREPLGWANIAAFLDIGQNCQGCFIANTVREISILPKGAREAIDAHLQEVETLLIRNMQVELPRKEAQMKASLILTFNAGLRLGENLSPQKTNPRLKEAFLKLIH